MVHPWLQHHDTVHGCFEGTFRDFIPYPFGLMFPETYEQEVRHPTRQSMKQKPLQWLYAAWKRVSSEILSYLKQQIDASAQEMQRRMGRTSVSQREHRHTGSLTPALLWYFVSDYVESQLISLPGNWWLLGFFLRWEVALFSGHGQLIHITVDNCIVTREVTHCSVQWRLRQIVPSLQKSWMKLNCGSPQG